MRKEKWNIDTPNINISTRVETGQEQIQSSKQKKIPDH